ncbi:MAG: DNA replication and repair protein RecF, partial [Bacteroidales bacterium]|nr:DNA replication and repair protein RecF [Bacteroidales bacterium]
KKKSFKRNNKEYERLSDHIGLIPLVTISPYDSNLILSGSEDRRKFVDIIVSQFDKDYLNALLKYNRVLAQRNQLLKQFGGKKISDIDSFEVWDEQLCSLANIIFKKRTDYIKNIIPIFQKYYNFISDDKETVELIYKSQLSDNECSIQIAEAFEKDRTLQYTSVGIHRDDLIFLLNSYPLKKNASQGQQKSFLIALKLAQFDYIKNISKIKPILLFDDIFDKLDALRVKQIISLVADNNFGQIFITDTNLERLDKILNEIKISFKIFKINSSISISEKEF